MKKLVILLAVAVPVLVASSPVLARFIRSATSNG